MNLPPYSIFPQLKNNKVLLRDVEADDLNDLIEISYYDGVKAATIQQAAEMQEKIHIDYMNSNSIHWGIADVTNGKIVGTCGYYRGFNESNGELGCVLLPHFRGEGFMTSAMQLAIDFGKNEINLTRIWAATTKKNEKAIKLLERLGFVINKESTDDEIEYELLFKPPSQLSPVVP